MTDQELETLSECIRSTIIAATGGAHAPPEIFIEACLTVIEDLKNMIQCVKEEHGLDE